MGPFDNLTEAQRQQVREAHAANKEREMREAYCNHDPAAVRYGVCECGTVVDEQDLRNDAAALDQIAAVLRETDWGDPACAAQIAAIVHATGRETHNTTEPDDIACGQADETGEDEAR